jgi:undecaprenyl pyrophosphate phosphatase UppP
VKAALLAICYVCIVAAIIVGLMIHDALPVSLLAIVVTMAVVVGFVIFVDDTRQQRRKWRDHPARRAGIMKDWRE